MALRNIRKDHDGILRKKSKPVSEINDNIRSLLKDMSETMYANNGVGLAAPQIGILKRIVVIDDGENGLLKLIDPEIIGSEGEQISTEGCLSVPEYNGDVKRPAKVHLKAMDENGSEIQLTGEGFLAVIICHELDHLDGVLFTDKAEEVYTKPKGNH